MPGTFGDSRRPLSNGAPAANLKPGDYIARLESISEPQLIKSNFRSGEQEVRRWIFVIDGQTHEERVTNSTWPGGQLQNGQYASPSKMYTWVKGLTGISERKQMQTLQIEQVLGWCKVRLESNKSGYPHITMLRRAKGDELPTPPQPTPPQTQSVPEEIDPFEEPQEEEVPF